MHAAERLPQERPSEVPVRKPRRKQRVKTKKVAKKKYVLEMLTLMVCLCGVLALNIFLVGRFADITGTRHEVSSLDKKVERLQNQKEQLLVEIEKSSKLEWIEEEAKERLSMKYPDKDQLIYISVDSEKVNQISQRVQRNKEEPESKEQSLPQSIERIIHKFAGILRI